MKSPLAIIVVLFLWISVSFGQSEKTKRIRGEVINGASGLGIESVRISSKDTAYWATSKRNGQFVIKIPKYTDSLLFLHDEYQPKIILIKPFYKSVGVELIRFLPDSNDLPQLKNTLSFLPIKLITGAASIRYERFLTTNQSVGAYLTYYYRGREYFGTEEFTGFKASPYFRFYTKRNKSYGVYIQATAIVAYFNFTELNYVYEGVSTLSVETNFWTAGAGVAFGITDVFKNSKHFIIDINIGFQIMPSTYPMEITDDHGRTYSHNGLWWYAGGPGSLIEIKLAFGGIF